MFNADPSVGAIVSSASKAHQRLNELNHNHVNALKIAVATARRGGILSADLAARLCRLAQAADAVRHITEFGFARLLDEFEATKLERAGWGAAHGHHPLQAYD